MRYLFGVIFYLITYISVFAADYPAHRGDSQWGFDAIAVPSDTYVVNDADGSTIDRYMFRHNGDIVINVPIRRYVGPTDGNGYLQNVDALIEKGVVGETVNIYMPAYDVDEGRYPVFDCDGDYVYDQLYDEVNEVYFNGEKLGKFRGQNQRWFQQTFTIPVSKLKFPSNKGGVGSNEVRVKIDVANSDVVLSSGQVGCVVWATEVDWVGIQFKTASPIVLVHGIRSDGDALSNLKDGFEAAHLLADNSIKLNDRPAPSEFPVGCGNELYNQSIAYNVEQLKTKIPAIAKEFGTTSVNLVTHSKGGLDSRGFLSATRGENAIKVQVGTMSGQPVMHKLKTNSLITLNTPHKGSVLATYGVEARQMTDANAENSGNIFLFKGVKAIEGSYYCDLTPRRASAFVSTTMLPNGIGTASVATSADANNNRRIDNEEGEGFYFNFAADISHHAVGWVSDVTVDVIPSDSWYLPDEVRVNRVFNDRFMTNDAIVTQDSASQYSRYTNINNLNHLNVHKLSTAEAIAKDAQSTNGLVNWRAK